VTFALVHGAWHGAWAWDALIPEFEARSHRVVAPDLPCEDVNAGAAEYAQVVIDALEFDARLRAVEDKVKSADERHWRRTDPEADARVEQFRNRADSYHAQAAKARAAGDERKARQADAQAVQWEEWLKTARGAVDR